MGHTVSTQRQVIETIIKELQKYEHVLDEEEQETFQNLLKEPYNYMGSISHANSLNAWAFLTVSICLEQEKEIQALREEIERYKSVRKRQEVKE